MQPYFYKIQEIATGRYYVGCQYGKNADPSNFFIKYFTSNNYIKSKLTTDFIVKKVLVRKDARKYEERYLKKCYNLLGREKFLLLMINRNLAPGIIHDEREINNISERMKKRWKNGLMNEAHQKASITRKSKQYKKIIISDEEKQKISERMKTNNPMFKEEIRKKHKEAVNSENSKRRKSEIARGNTYVKNRAWYNNGEKTGMFYSCPEGWIKGRLNPHWNHTRKKKNGKIT